MRRAQIAVLVVMLGSTAALCAAARTEFQGKPVTVAELDQILSRLDKVKDGTAANELYHLQLTERASSARLATWRAALPGAKARSALTELVDASTFLSLPAAEIPALPAPDVTEQKHIASLAVDYLRDTIPRLPNFYATRTTVRYDDTSTLSNIPGMQVAGSDPFHEAGKYSAMVIYRDHQEVVNSLSGKKRPTYDVGLVTRGTFGPIMANTIQDAAHGKMTFSHWEQCSTGLGAVFLISVQKADSHYDVAYGGPGVMTGKSAALPTAYHGEIALDPATGAILRLVLESDTDLSSDMLRADLMVEYGPVEIAGKKYISPQRSVALSQARAVVRSLSEYGNLGNTFTRINDVSFTDYHEFRGEVRILTSDPPGAESQR